MLRAEPTQMKYFMKYDRSLYECECQKSSIFFRPAQNSKYSEYRRPLQQEYSSSYSLISCYTVCGFFMKFLNFTIGCDDLDFHNIFRTKPELTISVPFLFENSAFQTDEGRYQKALIICYRNYIIQTQMDSNSQKKRFEDMRKALDEKSYQIIKSIGKGAFGEVVLARNRVTDVLFAVKIISKIHIKKKPFLQKYIDQEIDILKKLNHPNIVRYQQQFTTPDFIVIIMEYCEQGNLLTYQAKLAGKTFPLKQAIKVVVEIMKGLKCIHEKNFIHRDIKSENVLLKKEGGQITYKIADFGFARSIGGVGAKTHCGTEKYMAPEIISNSYYGVSVDIWALGILFYFMLFAEYPFKGHDMKAEIQRRCSNPSFSLAASISKKEKLKDTPSQLQDFFKRIFVVDSKKRMAFSNIVSHPLFAQYQGQFQDNIVFYNKLEKNQEFHKDEVQKNDYGFDSQMEPEDDSRAHLLKKKGISNSSKHLERELEEINFEIQKAQYLKECAIELFDNYSSYLTYSERLAAKFYLLKAYIFYSDPLLQELSKHKMPQSLAEVDIEVRKWVQCTKTVEYNKYISKMEEENMKAHLMFEDTYSEVNTVLHDMPIKNFEKGYRLTIDERTFDQLKFSYRSTTSYIFKSIHENKRIDPHTRNKIKMRLFCCHMINRIFNRKQIPEHFPFFMKWLKAKKIEYPHVFDFLYFKKWIYEESQENLERNIALLHKTFF